MLKEGASEDFTNRDAMMKLLRFASTHSADATQNGVVVGLRVADEGQAGQDLLRRRGQPQRGACESAARGVPQARHRGAVAVGPDRRMADVVASRSSTARSCRTSRAASSSCPVSRRRRTTRQGAAARARQGRARRPRERSTALDPARRLTGLRRARRLRRRTADAPHHAGGRSNRSRAKPTLELNSRIRSSVGSMRRRTKRVSPSFRSSCSTRRRSPAAPELDDPASYVKRVNDLLLELLTRNG